jgi:signal transduction histidine kinase/HAMP domain-containing protein
VKIKTKLGIGFTLMLLLLVGITSFGYERLNQMHQSMNHFYDNRFEKVRVALTVRSEINSSGRVMNDMIIGDQDPGEGVKEITARLTNAREQYKVLSKMELSNEEQNLMVGIMNTAEGYAKSLTKFIELVNQGKLEDAKKLYVSNLRNDQRLVIDSMDGLIKTQENALKQEMNDSRQLYDRSIKMVAILTIIGLLLGLAIVLWVFPSITRGLNLLGRMADSFAKGRLRGFARIDIKSQDELGELAQVFKRIALDLQVKNEREALLSGIQRRQGRINAEMARVTELLQPSPNAKLAAQTFISEFAPILNAAYGLLYLTDPFSNRRLLELSGSYAAQGDMPDTHAAPMFIRPGEGLTGQCFRDGKAIVLDEVPEGYFRISSGLGASQPKALIIHPIIHEDEVVGVVELASIIGFDSESRELLVSLCDKLGTILNNIRSRQRMELLLRESQAMTEELQAQSEELISQQEELRKTNDILEGQQMNLEEHINRIESQNQQIEQVNSELERQALQLALTSKYKSEFLANMSHELRTPLNSLLILSEFLSENKEGNLSDKQREYIQTIHLSGNDLLKMIDEILDLSKVEAGKMDIHPEWMVLGDLSMFLDHMYAPMATSKNLTLVINSEDDIPSAIWTDGHRLKQIMRNLLSNAIKFTEIGSITVSMRRPDEKELQSPFRYEGIPYLAFSVSDSGIGIPAEKSELIFEAFRQADGTTSRKYGGTGLGLTISRELSHLLGGWIHLDTVPGKGSTFTLVLPERIPDIVQSGEEDVKLYSAELAAVTSEAEFGADSRAEYAVNSPERLLEETIFENKKILLVDDDVRNVFALSSMLEHWHMNVVYAENGKEALSKLETETGFDLVLMDIMMPEMDGYEAMRRIRENADWNNIPIIALTAKAMKDDQNKCMEAGASDYITKPVNADQLLSLMTLWLHR